MPVLNLGRVRPVFRGSFVSLAGSQVEEYDVCTHAGSAWFFTSQTPETVNISDATGNYPGTPNGSSWRELAKGVEAVGAYTIGVTYYKNQVVQYGSSSFIAKDKVPANLNYIPGTTAGAPYWQEFATGFGRFAAVYSRSTDYGTGDIVTHKGSTYIAKTSILQANDGSHEPARFSDWEMVALGFDFLGDWETLITTNNYFAVGSVVQFRGSGYVVNARFGVNNTVNPATDSQYTKIIDGISLGMNSDPSLRGVWQPTMIYYEGELVSYKNGIYIANRLCNAGERPGENPVPANEGWSTMLELDTRFVQQQSISATRVRYKFIGYTGDGAFA